MNEPKVVNIKDKLSQFSDHWNPKIIGRLHGIVLKVVKLKGEFNWHHHDDEDELFWVINGKLVIHFRDKDITINEGEFLIIPKKVEHKPEAKEEVEIVLIEPEETRNTGNVTTENTVEYLDEL